MSPRNPSNHSRDYCLEMPECVFRSDTEFFHTEKMHFADAILQNKKKEGKRNDKTFTVYQ